MKKSLLLLLLVLAALTQTAVAQRLIAVGSVWNEQRRTPVEFATVSLLRGDTIHTTALTDENGAFRIKARTTGKFTLRVASIGYKTVSRTIHLDAMRDSVFLDSLFLYATDQHLGMATVTATVARVEQVEDTTVFNAAAYRVPEGSTLEALVKQFPGVEVSEDGSVKWNGKTVQEFLINGKDFFKGDTQIAMKNLPTTLVNKVKAYDKKSDYTEMTGIDDGNETTVLDIITKRELNESWISNIDLGYGTKDRFSGKIFATRFTDRLRLTAFGSANNVGDRGFGSVRGFGGGGGGLTNTKSAGFDFSYDNGKQRREAGRFETGGSIQYSHSTSHSESTSASERFLTSGTTSSFSNSFSHSQSSSNSVSTQMRIQWSPDSMTNLNFRPSFSYSDSHSHSRSESGTFNADPYDLNADLNMRSGSFVDDILGDDALHDILVNTNRRLSASNGRNSSVQGNLTALRRFGSKGRNINFNASASYSTSRSYSFSLSDIYYPERDGEFINQFSTSPSKNWNYSLRLGYTEPLWGKWFGEVRYEYAMRYQDQDRTLYKLQEVADYATAAYGAYLGEMTAEEYEAYLRQYGSYDTATSLFRTLPEVQKDIMDELRDLQNSRYATYRYQNHKVNVGVRYNNSDVRFNAGVELNPEHTKLDYTQDGIRYTPTRTVFNVSPTVRLRFNFSKTDMLDVNFRGSSSQPSMTDLLAVVDDSNPLSVSMGNPGLKPSWSNTFRITYRGYNVLRQQGINANFSFQQTSRSITNRAIYNEATGASYSRPDNINGNWNTKGEFMFNTGVGALKNYTITTNTSISYSNSVGYTSNMGSSRGIPSYLVPCTYSLSSSHTVDSETWQYYDDLFASIPSKKNTTRNLGIQERLDLGYRSTYWDVALNGNVQYSHVRASINTANNLDTWQFSYGATGNVTLDCGLAFSTDIRMLSRRGYSDPSFNTNELIWNAQLSYSFLKGKALTVQAKFYDLLHNQSNISRNVSALSRSDSWSYNINAYMMFHVIYKLNIFGGKASSGDGDSGKGSKQNGGMRAMPMGGGYGGGGGMGGGRGGM